MKIYHTQTQADYDALMVDEVKNTAVCPSCWEERELFEVDEEYLCERCLEKEGEHCGISI